ncbi:MAG: hypothetical protein ACK4SU_05445 [Dictyoglomus sp.]
MISLDFFGKHKKIAFIVILIGLILWLIYPAISALTFGLSGSIISFCWLEQDIKKYGIKGYNRSIIKRYGILIILFLLSIRAKLLGVLLFLLGYIIGQWYMIIRIWRK